MEYSNTFSKRCHSYLQAMKEFPNAMNEEFITTVKHMNLSPGQIVVNIPAGCVDIQQWFPKQITYYPFELNTEFGNLVNQPVCSLSSIPLPPCSVDRVVSLAALHHATKEERVAFVKECHRILTYNGDLLVGDVLLHSPEDTWLNTFVDQHNPLGHKGIFWSESDRQLFEQNGFDVTIHYENYNWNFSNREDMIRFSKLLFYMNTTDDSIINSSLTSILNATETKIPWSLIFFKAKKKNPFTFIKPDNWNSLKLYEKLSYYKDTLTYEYAPFVDKLTVKDYITKQTNGVCKVARLVRILDSCEDISESDLIPGHILKTTHASGWNIFIQNDTNIPDVKKTLLKWNTTYIGNNEKHYQYIKPRFFIEETVSDFKYNKSQKAITFMFRCIHGEPISINVRDFTQKNADQNNYTLNRKIIGSQRFPFTLPPELEQMIDLAKKLSKPFEFCRVDFYLSDSRQIYFSEFTFTPSGGISFYPKELEIEFGKRWI